jgi:acyl carrier protein
MEIEKILITVKNVIEESTGTSQELIKLESTLFDELSVDSIDLVDILFELESHYDVELKVSDIEARAKEELGDVPYEVNGIITAEGIEAVKKYMTEIDHSKLVEGISVHELVKLFSVHSLCKIVQYRLESSGK